MIILKLRHWLTRSQCRSVCVDDHLAEICNVYTGVTDDLNAYEIRMKLINLGVHWNCSEEVTKTDNSCSSK